MARSDSTRVVVRQQRYYWPAGQFQVWRFIMYATGGTLIGIFAAFITINQQLRIGIPW